MPARHRSRQRALQVLFQWDQRQLPVEECISNFYETLITEESPEYPEPDPFMERLAAGTVGVAAEIDRRISGKSANWRLERMAVVDRNLLRLAIYEMTEVGTPAAVVIDEALELARQFSGEESVSFVNGVLDAIRRDLPPDLRPLHDAEALIASKLAAFAQMPTEALVGSLRPGRPESLKTRPDGTVLDGHHRIHVLRSRGYDVNRLPRDVVPRSADEGTA